MKAPPPLQGQGRGWGRAGERAPPPLPGMSSLEKCLFRSSGQYFFFLIFNLIYLLFLVVSGLRCCTWAFSSCGERGLLFIVVRGLLIAVASLVVEHGL